MNYKAKDYGGGPAVGLADDFTKFLQQMITTGSFGGVTAGQQAANADPAASTGTVQGVLNSILAGPSKGYMDSINQMISKDTENSVGALRSRFGASGGMSFGTPAAYAEGVMRAEAAPRQAIAYNDIMNQNKGLALQMLMPLLGMTSGIAGKGISQRETTLQPPGWVQGVGMGANILGAASGFDLKGLLGKLGIGGGNGGNGGYPTMPQVTPGLAGVGNGGNFDYMKPITTPPYMQNSFIPMSYGW